MSNDNQTVQENETLTAVDQAKQELEIQAATRPSDYMNPVVWKQMDAMSRVFIQSRAMPSYISNAAQLMVVLQTGLEMDMKPMESINSLYIVNGTVNVWGKAITKRFREHGYKISYEHGDDTCKATVTRGKDSFSYEYTFAEAEQSGIIKTRSGDLKPGWLPGINRKLKLAYGALNVISRLYTPEVLGSAEGIAEVAQDYTEQIEETRKVETAQEATIVQGGKSSSLSDFMKQRKAAKTEQNVTETAQESTESDEKQPESDESEQKPEAPEYTLGKEWQKKKREYFATLKEMKIDHKDVKEMEGFSSLNDLDLDALTDLVKRLKS